METGFVASVRAAINRPLAVLAIVSVLWVSSTLSNAWLRLFVAATQGSHAANLYTYLPNQVPAPPAPACDAPGCTVVIRAFPAAVPVDDGTPWPGHRVSARWILPPTQLIEAPAGEVYKFMPANVSHPNVSEPAVRYPWSPNKGFFLSGLYRAQAGSTSKDPADGAFQEIPDARRVRMDTPALLLGAVDTAGATHGVVAQDALQWWSQALPRVGKWSLDAAKAELRAVSVLPMDAAFRLEIPTEEAQILSVGSPLYLTLDYFPSEPGPNDSSNRKFLRIAAVVSALQMAPRVTQLTVTPDGEPFANISMNIEWWSDILRDAPNPGVALSRLWLEIPEGVPLAEGNPGRALFRVPASAVVRQPVAAHTPDAQRGVVWVVLQDHAWPVTVDIVEPHAKPLATPSGTGTTPTMVVRERNDVMGWSVDAAAWRSVSHAQRGKMLQWRNLAILGPGTRYVLEPAPQLRADTPVRAAIAEQP